MVKNMEENLKKNRKKKRKKRPKKFWVMIAELVAVILLLIVLIVACAAGGIIGKFHFIDFDKSDAGINENLSQSSIKAMEGYTNIALFGLDGRNQNNIADANSDSIMIASINNKTHEIKLVSVYRDTTLNIGAQYGDKKLQGINKANSAYAHGGIKNAVQMLNSNLDLNIEDFVAVNWQAVTDTIDALGGIELDITKEEVQYINPYINEMNGIFGSNSKNIWTAGKQKVDGLQATAYCRIRYTAGNDFRRASRQRIVLEAMLNKAKQADLGTLTGIINDVAPYISTSFDVGEMIDLAKDVKSYSLAATAGFPTKLTTYNLVGSCVVPLSLKTNVSELHKFLFENEEYEPSDVVESISETITKLTGLDENSSTDYDMTDYQDTVGKDNAFK